MTHVQKPRPRSRLKSHKLRKLLNRINPGAPRRCIRPQGSKKPRAVVQYARVKPEPRGYSGRNHALLRRLQSRKFLLPNGELRATLRQALASQGIHQMSRLAAKWEEIQERMAQIQLPRWEADQFRLDFNQWCRQGSPETRENYFWRIKYCGLIELGLEYRHWNVIRQLHQKRHDRGLKNALYDSNH